MGPLAGDNNRVILRDPELSLDALKGKQVGVVGFGAQGEAQALNLRDSGISVKVGLREGSASSARAQAFGFQPIGLRELAESSDVVAMLAPDLTHAEIFDQIINPFARHESHIVFAHGYNVHYKVINPREDLGLLLVAPKAIGPQLRRLYEQGKGAAALISGEHGDEQIAKAYAAALGSGRAGVILSSFKEETETDLFGEQVVLCGGLTELARSAFTTLVEAGYSPYAAYFECVFEIKLIADMMFERGIAGMIDIISDTAQFGAMTVGGKVIDDHVRDQMKSVLKDIRSGEFHARWSTEQAAQMKRLADWRKKLRETTLEKTRKELLGE